jgi:prephenate dehydrogenase
MELLVVGAGEMGRWVARSVEATVAFADVDPSVAADAAAQREARHVPLDVEETFDAVCLAVPMSNVVDAVATHAPRAERAVLDVAGVMEPPVREMRARAPDRERVSLHPLFSAANAPGNVAVVADAPGPVTEALLADLRSSGNHLFETTPTEHDEAMETVQAGAHAAVLAYALAAQSVREEFETPVSSRLEDLVGDVTGGNPRVYREIQETFAGADRVADAARRIADADAPAFERLYRDATDAPGRDRSRRDDARGSPGDREHADDEPGDREHADDGVDE